MKNDKSKETIYALCLKQVEAAKLLSYDAQDEFLKLGTKLWERLKPIFIRLSDEMREKSQFKTSSVWILDDMPYNFVLCESINNNIGELGFRIGIRGQGVFIAETFYLPKDVEEMGWDGIMKFAIDHDYAAMDNNIVSPFGWRGFR